jgi:hypothetical protein
VKAAQEYGGRLRFFRAGFDDPRIASGPVVAVLGEQSHALSLALDDQAVAVLLDLMKPFVAGRNLGSTLGKQGSNADLRMKNR